MKHTIAIAAAAMIGFAGIVATATDADARRSGGISGFSGGGGGIRMGGVGGRIGGMRMSSPRMSGPRISSQRFSGPRVSGSSNMYRGPRVGNFDRPRVGNVDRPRRWAGNNNWNGRGRHHRRFRGSYAYWAAPLVASSAYYYGSECGWLRRRAIETGSGYWWDRYNDCRDGGY